MDAPIALHGQVDALFAPAPPADPAACAAGPLSSCPPNASPGFRGHIPALDGLRGLAILIVMFGHFVAPMRLASLGGLIVQKTADAGWSGVDLFFVLSGFLITGILFDAKDDRHYFRNFYARRTLRLFPLYYAVLLATCLVLPLAWGMRPNREQGWLWTYTSNLYPLFTGRAFYLPRGGHLPFQFSHFWSLAVEEQFYLVWPLVVLAFNRKALMSVCVALVAAALALRIGLWKGGAHWEVLFKFTLTRMDALAAGGWVALYARGPGGIGRGARPAGAWAALSAVGLAVLFVTASGLDRANPLTETIGYTVLAVFWAAALALVVALPGAAVVRYGLGAGWLRSLGRYSYGLYVLHGLLRPWFDRLVPRPTGRAEWTVPYLGLIVLHIAVAFSISFVLAWLSYHGFEKHFLRLKRLFDSTPRATPA